MAKRPKSQQMPLVPAPLPTGPRRKLPAAVMKSTFKKAAIKPLAK